MITKYKKIYLRSLYIFFSLLSLIIFFFSTTKAEGKAFEIGNIEISEPFQINFDKNEVINDGFKKAFKELLLLILNSSDQKKIDNIKLIEVRGMIDSFSIKEEKFINEIYYVKMGVAFNKKKIFSYLEKKNIFPSIPIKKDFLFIPVIIDENEKELLVFSKNKFFTDWTNNIENSHLINYILPTEDLEDLNILKKNFVNIEEYNFKEITDKYFLKDSIIALIFKNDKELRILSRISVKKNIILKNETYPHININNSEQVKNIINNLKIVYEDYWKNTNQINTSIKLILNIKIDSSKNSKISNFEKILSKEDLIYDFFISKFDNNFIYYQVVFNGTPNNFLKSMGVKKLNFDTQNKIWILE